MTRKRSYSATHNLLGLVGVSVIREGKEPNLLSRFLGLRVNNLQLTFVETKAPIGGEVVGWVHIRYA